jgi:hypothetical protein
VSSTTSTTTAVSARARLHYSLGDEKKWGDKVIVFQKVSNFAAVKMQVLNMTKQQFQVAIPAQKNFTFAPFFMPIDLVNSNNCVNTHTHTHTQGETNIKVHATRA